MTEQAHTFGVQPEPEVGQIDNNSIYDDLRSELATPVASEPKSLVVPGRPNVTIIYSTDIEFDLLRSWMKRAVKKNELDQLRLAYMVLSFTCKGVMLKGVTAEDSEGTAITFAHKQLQDMLHATDTQSCIRKMYGNDGHIISTSDAVMAAAGYDDMDMEEGGNPLSSP